MAKKVSSTVKLYSHAIKKLTDAQIRALEMTAERLHQDVLAEKVMPHDTGVMEGISTTVDYSQSKSGTVSLVTQTPYARRMYYHPEYNFRKDKNPNAQGKWLEPWISGEKKDFCKEEYARLFKQYGGVK